MINQHQHNIIQRLGGIFSGPSTRYLKKIVITPSAQSGQELRIAAARAGFSSINVSFQNTLSLAAYIHERDPEQATHRRLSAASVPFLVASLMDQMPDLADSPVRKSASHVARTITDLRQADISADAYRSVSRSEHRRVIGKIYRAYEGYLDVNDQIDDAELYRRVVEGIGRTADVLPPFYLVVVGSVQLSELAFRFVREVAGLSIGFEVMTQPGQRLPPLHLSATDRFAHGFSRDHRPEEVPDITPEPETDAPGSSESPIIFRAVGPENEIRGVFQEIIRRGLVFDDVEITYPVYDPYVRIVRSLSNRYDIPITLAAGVPVTSTRSGMALKMFLEWMAGGYSSEVLVEALRGRFIELAVTFSGEEPEDRNMVVADYLSGVRIAGTPDAYVRHLEKRVAIEARGNSPFSDTAWSAHRVRSVLQYLSPLLKICGPDRVATPRDLSDLVRIFLDRFVPLEPHLPDDHLEHVAKRELGSRFASLSEVIDVSIDRTELLRLAIEYLGDHFVRARAAAPGAVHVVPLTGSGFSGRPHAFIVGLDDNTFGRHASDDPFFPDSDREAVERDGSTRISMTSSFARSRQWYLEYALSNSVGHRCLSYAFYDPSDGREQFPSAALLGIMARHSIRDTDLPIVSWIPGNKSKSCFLDRTDVYLALGKNTRAIADLERLNRNLAAGRLAIRARELPDWSGFDGLISRKGLDPDLTGQEVSASRLETLFSCPYRFFLRYVLKASRPDEIDEGVWISPLTRGRIVHEGLRRWVEPAVRDQIITAPVDGLSSLFTSLVDDYAALSAPPNAAVYEKELHYFRRISLLYMADRTSNRGNYVPLGVERVISSREQDSTDHENLSVQIDLGNEHINLTGRIDRIDVDPDGRLSITDYKTGSDGSYESEDLLGGGVHLQWALYAYAVETMFEKDVIESGYLFLNEQTMGRRISADPGEVRADIESLISAAKCLTDEGAFVPSGAFTGVCSYCEFSPVCGDADTVKRRLIRKLDETQTGTPIGDVLSIWPPTSRRISSEGVDSQ